QQAAHAAAAPEAYGDPGGARQAPADARARRHGTRVHLRHAGRAHRHYGVARRSRARGNFVPRPAHHANLARGHLRRTGGKKMNLRAALSIYRFEMARTGRTLMQSVVSPVISTSLYFVVFGAAIGSKITDIEGVSYGEFIVPGLIMLTVLTQSVMN